MYRSYMLSPKFKLGDVCISSFVFRCVKPIRLTFALSWDVVSVISISTHLPPGTPWSCGILPQ